MRNLLKISLPLAILVASSSSASYAQLAQSPTWRQQVNTLERRSVGDTEQFNLSTTERSQLEGLDSVRANLYAQMDRGIATGRISPTQVTDFKAEIDRLESLRQSAVMDNKLTYPEAKQLLAEYDKLTQTINGLNLDSVDVTPAMLMRLTYGLYDVDRYRDSLLARLLHNLNNGTIDRGQYTEVRAELDRVTGEMERLRNRNGYLSKSQRVEFSDELIAIDKGIYSRNDVHGGFARKHEETVR